MYEKLLIKCIETGRISCVHIFVTERRIHVAKIELLSGRILSEYIILFAQ
jgi:hypothetical protein